MFINNRSWWVSIGFSTHYVISFIIRLIVNSIVVEKWHFVSSSSFFACMHAVCLLGQIKVDRNVLLKVTLKTPFLNQQKVNEIVKIMLRLWNGKSWAKSWISLFNHNFAPLICKFFRKFLSPQVRWSGIRYLTVLW